MNMQIIDNNQAYNKCLGTNGKIFSCIFIKKNGDIRKMVCRLGVKKHLKGGTLKYNPVEYNLLGVYDMEAKGYRMINFNTIIALQVSGKQYVINEHQKLVSQLGQQLFGKVV